MNCTDRTDYTDAVGQDIRSIRKIRTEQITNTETHGNTRMQMGKNIRKIREIRTELNEHGDTRNYTEADEQRFRDTP